MPSGAFPFGLYYVNVQEICRKMGISEATFYNWKKKFGGLGVGELRRLRQLEEENAKLKQIVADLSLDKQMLQDVLKKNSEDQAAAAVGKTFDRQLQSSDKAGLQGGAFGKVTLVL